MLPSPEEFSGGRKTKGRQRVGRGGGVLWGRRCTPLGGAKCTARRAGQSMEGARCTRVGRRWAQGGAAGQQVRAGAVNARLSLSPSRHRGQVQGQRRGAPVRNELTLAGQADDGAGHHVLGVSDLRGWTGGRSGGQAGQGGGCAVARMHSAGVAGQLQRARECGAGRVPWGRRPGTRHRMVPFKGHGWLAGWRAAGTDLRVQLGDVGHVQVVGPGDLQGTRPARKWDGGGVGGGGCGARRSPFGRRPAAVLRDGAFLGAPGGGQSQQWWRTAAWRRASGGGER